MTIKLNETYKDSSGCDVRIICTDKAGTKWPIVGLRMLSTGTEYVCSYTQEGGGADFDLILPPRVVFVNFIEHDGKQRVSGTYDDHEEAKRASHSLCTYAAVRVELPQ